jgi:hypothetical protein
VCARRNEAEVPARGGHWGEGPGARLRGAPWDRLLSRAAHPARALRTSAHINSAQRLLLAYWAQYLINLFD